MNRTGKTALVFALTASLVLSSAGAADAKAKKPKLSKSKVTITVGKTKKITVKKAKPKKTKWTVNKKGKKVVKLSKKKKKSVVIKGKKKGKATVTAKITVGKKTYKKKVKVTVKKKSTSTPKPSTPTQKPGTVTPTPNNGNGGGGSTATATATATTPGDSGDDSTPTPGGGGDDATPTPGGGGSDYDPTQPHDIDLANDVLGDVTKNADGSITAEGANPIFKLPTTFAEGDKVKIRIEGSKDNDDVFRYYLLQGEQDGSRSSAVANSGTDGVPKGAFYWTKTLTVGEEGDDGCTTASYMIFKASAPGSPMPKLTIKKITILPLDAEEDGVGSLGSGEEDPTDDPNVTPTPTPVVTPETEVIEPSDKTVDDQEVKEYTELDPAADYVVEVNGSKAEITAADLAKVFDIDKIAELWAEDGAISKTDDIYGKTVEVSGFDELGARTVTVTGKNNTAVYKAVKMASDEGTLKFQLTDEEGNVDIITIADGTYTVTRDEVKLVCIAQDENGTYTMDVDKAWAEENGFVLSKVTSTGGGSDTPSTDDPATDNPTTDNPTTDNPTTDDPTTDDPTTDDPTTDDPTTDEPTSPEPEEGVITLKGAVVEKEGVVVSEDGSSVTITNTNNVFVRIAEDSAPYLVGTRLKVEVEGTNESNAAFRFYLSENSQDNNVTVEGPYVSDSTEGAFAESTTLTVSADKGGKATYLLFKGPDSSTNITKLTITKIKVTEAEPLATPEPGEDEDPLVKKVKLSADTFYGGASYKNDKITYPEESFGYGASYIATEDSNGLGAAWYLKDDKTSYSTADVDKVIIKAKLGDDTVTPGQFVIDLYTDATLGSRWDLFSANKVDHAGFFEYGACYVNLSKTEAEYTYDVAGVYAKKGSPEDFYAVCLKYNAYGDQNKKGDQYLEISSIVVKLKDGTSVSL